MASFSLICESRVCTNSIKRQIVKCEIPIMWNGMSTSTEKTLEDSQSSTSNFPNTVFSFYFDFLLSFAPFSTLSHRRRGCERRVEARAATTCCHQVDPSHSTEIDCTISPVHIF